MPGLTVRLDESLQENTINTTKSDIPNNTHCAHSPGGLTVVFRFRALLVVETAAPQDLSRKGRELVVEER